MVWPTNWRQRRLACRWNEFDLRDKPDSSASRGRWLTTMQTDDFIRRWPFCYHVTFTLNVALIREAGVLYSAQTLLRSAGHSEHRRRRGADMTVQIGDQLVVLRNQRALDPSALSLPPECSVDDYVMFLNQRAYFWPGTAGGPVDDGVRMLASHVNGWPAAIIRVPSTSLVDANSHVMLQVADCNTGASWIERGRKSYRAPRRSQPIEAYSGDPESITEVSFCHAARLPRCAQIAASYRGGWESL